MKFIHSDRTNASYTIIGKYIANVNTESIIEFGNDIEPVYYGIIDKSSLEKLTEAYKSSTGDFRNITNYPYTIEQLLDETNGNTFYLLLLVWNLKI